MKIQYFGNFYNHGTGYAGGLYGINELCFTITASIGHGGMGMILIKV
jgi:hypothetical protein